MAMKDYYIIPVKNKRTMEILEIKCLECDLDKALEIQEELREKYKDLPVEIPILNSIAENEEEAIKLTSTLFPEHMLDGSDTLKAIKKYFKKKDKK